VIRERKVARVRDIAQARNVKAGSVTPAMKRLADLGLVTYGRREFIELTPAGEEAARRVLSRHQILTTFLSEVLMMSKESAEVDACAMEHHISDEAMDRMVRFFEFMRSCPNTEPGFLHRFHACSMVNTELPECPHQCEQRKRKNSDEKPLMSLADLKPGESGTVRQINTSGAIRQRLLDMGVLPDVVVRIERVAPSGDPVWIKLHGYQLSLRMNEAKAVLISDAA
jgi:DtxR family transcriptional regulator, Mn-dependent transcriptional regulator